MDDSLEPNEDSPEPSEEIQLPKDFDITDSTNGPATDDAIIYAGTVEQWKRLEFLEKAKLRPYIASAVILVWMLSTTIYAIRSLMAENFLLLIPTTLITIPLYRVLKFYFGGG